MNKWIWNLILPLVVVGIGIGIAAAMKAAEEPTSTSERPDPLRVVDTATVDGRTIATEVIVFGTVKPRTETTLVAEVTGRVLTTHDSFHEGGFFGDEAILLTIDRSIYQAELAAAQADQARAEANEARESAEAAIARREWKQFGSGEASPLVRREPQLAQASAEVAAAKARVERATIDLARTEVKAPYAGRIRARLVEEGQYVTAGTPVAVIYATDYAEVRLPISLEELAYLELPLREEWHDPKTAPEVTLEVEIGRRVESWPARLHRTEGELDPKTRVLYAVARIRNPYHSPESGRIPLLVGQFVRARLTGKEYTHAAELPRSALGNDDTVWVLDENETLRRRTVVVHRLGRQEVLIDASGLDGERVVTSRLDFAVEGMAVRVREPVGGATAPPSRETSAVTSESDADPSEGDAATGEAANR